MVTPDRNLTKTIVGVVSLFIFYISTLSTSIKIVGENKWMALIQNARSDV